MGTRTWMLLSSLVVPGCFYSPMVETTDATATVQSASESSADNMLTSSVDSLPSTGAEPSTGVAPTTTTGSSSSTGPATATTGSSSSTSGASTTVDDTSGSETGVDSSSSEPPPLPPGETTLQLEILPIKMFSFSWPAAVGATYYQLHERPSAAEPYAQVGNDIAGTSTSVFVPLHFRAKASYFVRACNDGGCTDSPPLAVADSLAAAVGYFKASNNKSHFYFGESIAVSADGATMVVGSPYEDGAATGVNGEQKNQSAPDAGAAYVFVAKDGAWTQQAYVKASNTATGDRLGYAVALSADGDTLAVGAFFEDGGATGVNGNQGDGATDSGAVYVYKRSADLWLQHAYIKASNTRPGAYFGLSLALSGDGKTLAVGTENETSGATGIDGNQNDTSTADAGAVYVFTETGGAWSQQAYVKASNTGAGDRFGHYLALSHNGDTLAVSAVHEDSSAKGINGIQGDNGASDSGAVYVYTRNDTAWIQQAYIKSSNSEAGDWFGARLDLSADGETLVVGALYENSAANGVDGNQGDNSLPGAGAAYVFNRTGDIWTQQTYLKASNTGEGDAFGSAVALSDDGNVLAIAASLEDSASIGVDGDADNDAAGNSGAIYMFVRAGTSWAQRSYVKASTTSAGHRHGESLALSGDGSTLVVGTNLEKSAAQGIGGNQADISADQAGAAYVY